MDLVDGYSGWPKLAAPRAVSEGMFSPKWLERSSYFIILEKEEKKSSNCNFG